MKRILKYPFVAVAILVGACAAKNDEPSVAGLPENDNQVVFSKVQFENAGIQLGQITKQHISTTVKVNGKLDVPPQQMVSISVPLGGFLKSTTLLQGSKVKKGERLAVIGNIEFVQLQQDYLEAKSQLEFADKDYQRQQQLAEANVNAQKALQQAHASFTTWQSRVAGLMEKLKIINISIPALESGHIESTVAITSPIDGYVTQVNANVGKFVGPNEVLFEIVDTRHLHAELTVFEKDVPSLKVGQKVRFTLATETVEREGTVYLINRIIEPDRTVRVHCHIKDEDTNLLPGMYVKAMIETTSAEVDALPREAVVNYQGSDYIFYREPGATGSDNHRFIMKAVQTGAKTPDYTEVIVPEDFPRNVDIIVGNAYSALSKLMNREEEG